MSKPQVTVHTDGSCEPNPGPGGWAAILQYHGHEKVLTGHEANTTNNRMELQAAIAALQVLQKPCQVVMYTDSQYLQQGITAWLPNWIRRGWRKSNQQPVLNADLWQRLYELTQQHEITWQWLRGHAGHAENERADRLAHEAMQMIRRPVGRNGR